MIARPDFSILIPTWNNLPMLQLCLRSIAAHSTVPYQVVLHINDGSDGTLAWVRQQRIEHTWTPDNVGICRAMNLAAQRCRGEYLVYVNDDMYVLPGWDRPLFEQARVTADREPALISGTMIQARPIAPSSLKLAYGAGVSSFEESRLLRDHAAGRLACQDWNGATWPPSCVHRKWWDVVGGYSVEFSPGFYSDIDFSMKLWHIGCRRFVGSGRSLVYHFGEQTTSVVRGPKKRNVREARRLFLRKWRILPTTFKRFCLRCGEPYRERVPEPDWQGAKWEQFRLRFLSTFLDTRDLLSETVRTHPPRKRAA